MIEESKQHKTSSEGEPCERQDVVQGDVDQSLLSVPEMLRELIVYYTNLCI